MGKGGVAAFHLNLNTRLRYVVSFIPKQLYTQVKGSRCPLTRRLDGTQSLLGITENKSLTLARN
jgi:hypothetical protein